MISSPYRKEHDIQFVESQESPTQDQSKEYQSTPDSPVVQYVSPAKNEDSNMDENDLKAMEEIDNLLWMTLKDTKESKKKIKKRKYYTLFYLKIILTN